MNAPPRDYSLLGRDADRAVERGLASAEWYRSEVPRREMKALMRRGDARAARDVFLWLGSMVVLACATIALWPSWWALPPLLAYGVLYGSGCDARWHECGHGTAFRTPWMNDVVYQIASFMHMRNPVTWRWSHTRHHTDTIIVGRDPEIAVMRPPAFRTLLLNVFGLVDVWQSMRRMVLNAAGRLHPEEATFVPESERHEVFRVARIWCAIYASTIMLAIAAQSMLPLLLVGLPRLYGCWHMVMTGVLQHAALADDVVDHRMNTRTVYMNPVSRFIYLNMNYHVEHHMFPMVPYHQLPALHETIRDDLPEPSPSILAGYREIWPILRRQLAGEDVFLTRELPPTARPYLAEPPVVAGREAEAA